MSKSKLEEILEGFETSVRLAYAGQENTDRKDPDTDLPIPRKIYFGLAVCKKGWGFGEFAFSCDESGQVYIDAEYTSKETVKEFLNLLVDSAILDTDEDPERHRLYNEFKKRQCGPGCNVCAAAGK